MRRKKNFFSRLEPRAARLLRNARVAHLATADRRGRPHVVPICFAIDGDNLITPLDAKPKKSAPLNLKRVRNIAANPRVAVVVDCYEEDWRRLGYVLLQGKAKLLRRGAHHRRAVRCLKAKYLVYRAMDISRSPVISITIEHTYVWFAKAAK
ncbi:MAG TPA: TIGR03668 family PPOX class F420-dependent oxidoreductase [Candidatus Binatia bacterium]|nr:TIGR03668 family PPOX class F420-dependent oxidoreductase [Candidatus Binatia bacterium]